MPAAYLVTVIGLVAGGTLAPIGPSVASTPIPNVKAARSASVPDTLVYVGGYDSSYHLTPSTPLSPVHFSYRGSDARGRPLADSADNTRVLPWTLPAPSRAYR